MSTTDVVVVGAGPAGSAAAFFLAAHGVNITVIDKSSFPRDKICGDGVGPRSLSMLEKMGLYDWASSGVYHRCNRVRFFAASNDYFEANIPPEDSPYTHFYVTPRKELDLKLIEAAEAAGAKFLPGCKALSVIRSGGYPVAVRVNLNGKETDLSCRVVVCADGTHGTFATNTGISSIKPIAFAVRAYYSNIDGLDDCVNVLIDNDIPEGYAWIFPMSATTANIGLGVSTAALKKHDVNIKELLNRFIRERDTGPIDIKRATPESEVRGAYLSMGCGSHHVVSDGIVLVGDAAALVSPLSGEGIAYALESGELAAQAIIRALNEGDVSSAKLKPYQDHLDEHYFKEYRSSWFLRRTLFVFKNAPMNAMIRRGIKHINLAEKFTSVMMNTANPAVLLHPRYLRYYIL